MRDAENPVLQMEHALDLRMRPIEMRRGDDLLSARREMRQQGIAAGRVEFAENIIQQQQRKRLALFGNEPGLRQTQRQCQRPLLPLAGEVRTEPVQFQNQFIPVRPHPRLPQSAIFFAAGREVCSELPFPAARLVTHP